ncbi:probable cytochrome P450 6a13 [Schistocerca nitens]|uniref:probable cytochrome P450 6a13 n=1 Tax=Schistocerca nitens TaxID=7011 RepID=UPI0021190970|nr:probable cytochrome P450 6a13 [Schistocerca nitens]
MATLAWSVCDVGWVTAALSALALTLLVVGAHVAHNYWRRMGVVQASSLLFVGHAGDLLLGARNLCDVMDDVYHQLEGHPYGGFYMLDRPCLMLRDPDLIWKMKQDSEHYSRRAMKMQMKGIRVDPISKHLFDVDDERWREVMQLYVKGFSPARTERLSCWLEQCGRGVQRALSRRIQGIGWRDVDLLAVCSRFATDSIGCCAFGIECGAIDDPRSTYLQLALKAMYPTRRKNFVEFLSTWHPEIAWIFFFGFFTRDTYDFFKGVALGILQHRQENHLCRDDVMHEFLIARQNGLASEENTPTKFSDDSLVAYVFATFGFGLGIVARVLSFCLYELSLHTEVQTRARQQVDAVLKAHGGQLSYEAVQEMTYLDMVLSETLRLYPVVGGAFVEECTQTHRLSGPGGSSIVVEAGTRVVAPLFSLLRDRRHFPEPLQFIPERWSPENSAGRHPGVYIPYGEGQRRCVAEDFSKTTMKFGLASLLEQFELSPCSRTPNRPAKLHPQINLLTPRETLWVRVSQRAWLSCD